MLELLDAMKVVSGGKHVLSARHVDKYLRGMDADGDGLLTLHEFTSYLGTKYLCKPAKDADPQMVQMVRGRTYLGGSAEQQPISTEANGARPRVPSMHGGLGC